MKIAIQQMRILQIAFLSLVLLGSACKEPGQSAKNKKTLVQGETMGTYYRVTYLDSRDLNPQIKQVLKDINDQLSTYIPTSSISRINASGEPFKNEKSNLNHFIPVFEAAKNIHQTTTGSFDPTVMPLVNYWGFGYTEKKIREANKQEIEALLQLIGFDDFNLTINDQSVTITKTKPKAQLDFSAIAKGYGVDQIAVLLEGNGIQNYLVDIGGEVRAKGKNNRNAWWTVGINTPKPEAKVTDLQQIIALQNKSIASSGNYRIFYEKDGKKYGHTINPKTGMPELNQLLSASIIAKDCMTADAYATASMVMGLERAYEMVETNPNLEGYFIYGTQDGSLDIKYTEAIKPLLLK